jgi:Na+/proline symporter
VPLREQPPPAVFSVIFRGAYAAAQLSAGGKALNALFDWPIETGAVLGAAIVVAYCLAGGIRASIWTDAAQSAVMLGSMALLFVTAVSGLGGPGATWRQLSAIPGYTDWFPPDLLFPGVSGVMLFVVGWMFAGFSVVGQPHVMVRFMALDKPTNMTRARLYYYGFFTVFYFLANGVGLLSRLYLPELSTLDPELALPTMAMDLLPPVAVGMILAGIFAATMSTADSLVLSCSAALTHDLLPRAFESKWAIKGATFAVAVLALVMALSGNQSVFSLVILAWSVLASAFAPLLVVYALGARPSERVAVTMVVAGIVTALTWRQSGLQDDVYEGMPGILAGLLAYAVARVFSRSGAPALRGSVRTDRPSESLPGRTGPK